MTCSEEVRDYVVKQYISPARNNGQESVQIRAGTVHNELHWTGRVPSVCQTLGSRKFQDEAGVELVSRSRPGPSTTVVFTYRVLDKKVPSRDADVSARADAPGQKKPITLLDLYGAGAVVFRQVGGGEAFLEGERAGQDPDPWERFEIEQVTFRKKARSI
jgi:hypothetical protein